MWAKSPRSMRCPFELGRLGLGPGASETVARGARYHWLRAVQKTRGARYLVTAHQRDDQVETVLLRALQGSGPAGLAGIPRKGPGGSCGRCLGSGATSSRHTSVPAVLLPTMTRRTATHITSGRGFVTPSYRS